MNPTNGGYKNIVVLIPAYNAKQTIRALCSEVLTQGFRLVVVDDGSLDGTPGEISDLKLELILSAKNQGKGAALKKGLERVREADFSAVILMDSDGQHDPRELPRFAEAVTRGISDVVIGNRMEHPRGMPLIRRLTNRFLSKILSLIAGQRIPDSQCGYRALTRPVLEKITLRTQRFEIESEIILRAAKAGFKISSIPVRSVYRDEKSQIHPLRDTVRFFKFLASYLFFDK